MSNEQSQAENEFSQSVDEMEQEWTESQDEIREKMAEIPNEKLLMYTAEVLMKLASTVPPEMYQEILLDAMDFPAQIVDAANSAQ